MVQLKLFYHLLLTATALFNAQILFAQLNIDTPHTVIASKLKVEKQLISSNDHFPKFPGVINTKLNKDSSVSVADFIKKNLPDLYIHSGEVCFSGAGFPFVQRLLFIGSSPAVSAGHKISNALQDLLQQCRTGSEITFIKCSFKNTGGIILAPVNRTVRIQ